VQLSARDWSNTHGGQNCVRDLQDGDGLKGGPEHVQGEPESRLMPHQEGKP
jgi:hypothetical protein